MIAPQDCALILLAAGRSERFGVTDKLQALLHGKPLALHVVDALAEVPFGGRIAVCSNTELDFAARGFQVVRNADPAAGMGHSVALGVAAARGRGAAAVLIALADMPCVTAGHVLRLLDAFEGADGVVASSDGARPSPPALLGAGRFDALHALTGDAGARELIRGGVHITAAAGELADVDRPEDLRSLRASV